MGKLRDLLISRYAEHYSRGNAFVDPSLLPEKTRRAMTVTYGPLVATVKPGARILDLGCGTGIVLSWLAEQPGIVPVGCDSSPQQVELLHRFLPKVEVHCEDGLAFLQKHSGTLSGIFCTDVLEHIPDEDLLLEWVEAAYAALQPGGFFFCRVPNAANLTGTQLRYIDLTHVRSFTALSLLQVLEAANFCECRVVPVSTGHFWGGFRLIVEHLVHAAVFRLCGDGMERVFTRTVCMVGRRKQG